MAVRSSEFGQSERLTVRLRGLIRSYPRGIGIIKEFIQNADDAGATHLGIVMDWQHHPTEELPDPRMAVLMGPAMLLTNDRRFSDADLEAIQRIGEGSKTESAAKVGQFGYGFNTAYNVTDYPAFLTGGNVYCFDPHQDAVTKSGMQYGMSWSLEDLWMEAPGWPRTFLSGGLKPKTIDHDGTIFRLPIRDADRAKRSAISDEPFTATDFVDIVDHLADLGSAILLFTRRLMSVAVDTISSEGVRTKSLVIRTVNVTDVASARAPLLAELDGDIRDRLRVWEEADGALPSAVYRHDFEVVRHGESAIEAWLLSAGLFDDPEGALVRAAREMHQHREKAIPWAGVAARVQPQGTTFSVEPVAGRIYCGLPLPIETELSVHVNGYFDLDSSRQRLSVESGDVGGSAKARVEWNQALMESAVAGAYSSLIAFLASNDASRPPSGFYEMWPNTSYADRLLKSMGVTVYQRLVDQAVIRVRAGDEYAWSKAGDLNLPPPSWRKHLQEPLVADALPLPDPPVPAHVEDGFSRAGTPLRSLSPRALRDRLRTNADVNAPFSSAPRPCLQRRVWVENLLKFCMSDGSDDISGLPLALLCDGKLHTFNKTAAGVIFVGSETQRQIFSQFTHWFVDPEYYAATDLKPSTRAKVQNMTVQTVVVNLNQIVAIRNSEVTRPWTPNSATPPNEAWLVRLIRYLESCDDIEDQRAILESLPLVPDQFGRLCPPGHSTSPLLPPADGSCRHLHQALNSLRIPVASGSMGLLQALRAFADRNEWFLRNMTGPHLVDTLFSSQDAWTSTDAASDICVIGPILDFLGEERWSQEYSSEQFAILKALPIFPLTTGAFVVADSNHVFVPAGYSPPALGGDVHLLTLGLADRWRGLYAFLDVPLLDRSAFIRRVVLPQYEGYDAEHQYAALRWLRDEFQEALGELDDQAGAELRREVASAELVVSTDEMLWSTKSLYDPASKAVREILGDTVVYPSQSVYKREWEIWLSFFRSIEMMRGPRAADLLTRIDGLIERANSEGVSALRTPLLSMFEYIENDWERLSKARFRNGSDFCSELKKKSWFVALSAGPNLLAFKPPEDRLYRADELYMRRVASLVCSQAAIVDMSREPDKEVVKALGMLGDPPLEVVFNHFECIIALWENKGHVWLSPARVAHVAKDVYRYIVSRHRRAEAATETRLDANSARELRLMPARFEQRPCLWDALRERFWQPRHVFSVKVPFFEPLRTFLDGDDVTRAAFDLLGRLAEPSANDYVDFITDLKEHFGDTALPPEQLKQVLHALNQLSRAKGWDASKVLVPDSLGALASQEEVFFEDAPWLLGRVDPRLVRSVHEGVPATIMQDVGIRSISKFIVERPIQIDRQPVDPDSKEACEYLGSHIRTEQFGDGLRRLLRHQHGPEIDVDLSVLERVRLLSVALIKTELILMDCDDGRVVGRYEPKYHFDVSRRILLVAGASSRRIVGFVGQAINQILADRALADRAPLEAILRCRPEDIPDELDAYYVTNSTTESQVYEWAESPPDDLSSTRTVDEELTELDALSLEDNAEQPWGSAARDDGEEARSDPSDSPDDDRGSVGVNHGSPEAGSGSLDGVAGGPPDENAPQSRPAGRLAASGFARTSAPTAPGRQANYPTALASEDRPPVAPGTGKSAFVGGNRNSQMISYVGHDASGLVDPNEPDNRSARVSAIQRVIEFERASGRVPTVVEGIADVSRVTSVHLGDATIRHIMVKGLHGAWDRQGVPMTALQFMFAQESGVQCWLYVVEHVAGTPVIHRIHDPAHRITQFRFDNGWSTIGEGASPRAAVEPRVGMTVVSGGSVAGMIVDIQRGETMIRLKIRSPDDVEKWILYRPDAYNLEER